MLRAGPLHVPYGSHFSLLTSARGSLRTQDKPKAEGVVPVRRVVRAARSFRGRPGIADGRPAAGGRRGGARAAEPQGTRKAGLPRGRPDARRTGALFGHVGRVNRVNLHRPRPDQSLRPASPSRPRSSASRADQAAPDEVPRARRHCSGGRRSR